MPKYPPFEITQEGILVKLEFSGDEVRIFSAKHPKRPARDFYLAVSRGGNGTPVRVKKVSGGFIIPYCSALRYLFEGMRGKSGVLVPLTDIPGTYRFQSD